MCVCVHATVRKYNFVESVLSFHFTWVSENKLRSPGFQEQGPLLVSHLTDPLHLILAFISWVMNILGSVSLIVKQPNGLS